MTARWLVSSVFALALAVWSRSATAHPVGVSQGEYNLRRAECETGVIELSRNLPGIKALRDAEPDNARIVEFGISFFRRLLAHIEAVLTTANLARAEVEDGLKQLQQRPKRGD